jgi:hypothetical protein
MKNLPKAMIVGLIAEGKGLEKQCKSQEAIEKFDTSGGVRGRGI